MYCIPLEITGPEKIVRIIFSPSHVKPNGTLKPAAYRSKSGTDEVSVVRHDYVGADFCKRKGKEMHRPQAQYMGLAVTLAADIRRAGSAVHDSREVYLGHAPILHGMILEPGEPADSQSSLLITERCREIIRLTKYFPDPYLNSESWAGPDLQTSS